jgi:hypothetical protein
LKPLKEREFFKTLKVCDVIMECMDEKSGVITDLNSMKKKIDDILKRK